MKKNHWLMGCGHLRQRRFLKYEVRCKKKNTQTSVSAYVIFVFQVLFEFGTWAPKDPAMENSKRTCNSISIRQLARC